MRERKIVVLSEQDDTPVKGNAMVSGDAAEDRKAEKEILTRLRNGDHWAWAYVTVSARCTTCEAEGRDSLGACSYEDEDAFKADAYFSDMVETAKRDCDVRCTCPKDGRTPVSEHTSGGFVRTALTVAAGDAAGSVDVLDTKGRRLAQVNIFLTEKGDLMVDVVDVDRHYEGHRALAFANCAGRSLETSTVVGAHFTRVKS